MKTDAGFPVQRELQLTGEGVHLWRVNIPLMTPSVTERSRILSSEEQKRASRFHHAVDRNRFVIVRSLLRQILGSYLGKDPLALMFSYSKKEKPFLAGEGVGDAIGFNVSHSGDIALLAFGRGREIGVDVEQVRPDTDVKAIAERFFSTREQGDLAALPDGERRQAFFRCWTRKESFIKATGKGLSLPLRNFDVSLQPGDRDALLATRPDALERTHWRLQDVTVEQGYAAALCVSGNNWQLLEKIAQEPMQ